MNSDKLYKVQEQDLDRLKEILTVCFQNDPLYSTLIEDEATKKRLLPHLLECDITELFETCEVFADSPELKGVLILSDESDHRHAFYNYFVSLKESLITDGWLLHEDPTMKTFFNFVLGKDYLNSAWTAQLHETRRLHVIYLAVDPKFQHHGLAEMMMNEVIACADRNDMMISLETHNPKNVPFYEHLGFKIFGIVEKPHFQLKQYCMIKEL